MTTRRDKSIKALLAGCRKGNKQDWTELIDRISPVIFSACYRFRLTREESYDIFGKVSLLLLENLNNLRDDEKVFGYISTVAYHEATAVKAKSRMFDAKAHDIQSAFCGGHEITYSRPQVERDEELDMMSRAFDRLSKKCQEMLRLLFLDSDDISYRDISKQLGVPVSSIGPTRARCLKKLRSNMIKEGYEK